MAYGSILGQTPNLSNYVTNDQLTTKLNDYLPLNGGTMTGNINMNGKRLNNVPTPTSSLQAANKQYVDNQLSNYVTNNSLSSQLNNYLELSGGTMTGSLNMNGQKITNIPDGVNNGDAVNFGQLNDTVNSSIPFANSGLTFLGRYTGVRTNNDFTRIRTKGNLVYYSFISSLNTGGGTSIFSGTAYITSDKPINIYGIESLTNIVKLGTFSRDVNNNIIAFAPSSTNIMVKYYYDFYIYTGF